MALRVLVDAVSARIGGGGTLILSQMEALTTIEGIGLTILASGKVADRLVAACPGATVRVCRPLPSPLRVLWEQLALPVFARRFDVIYMPGNFALLLSRRPQVLMVQNAWYFTDVARSFRRRRCSRAMRVRLTAESALARASIRRADSVVTVSRSMLAGIEHDLGNLPHAMVIASATPALPDPAETDAPNIAQPYALVVAHDDPHKEWEHLVETFLAHPDLPRLVIVGATSRERARSLRRRVVGRAPSRVEFLGPVADPSMLTALYRGAACCVAHSQFESFGLTACEALSQGTPVAAADIPAHREICGAAAVYYDRDDAGALAEAVRAAARRPRGAAIPPERSWSDNARELEQALRDTAARF